LAARARLTEVIFASYFCPFEGRKSIAGALVRLIFEEIYYKNKVMEIGRELGGFSGNFR